MINPKNLGHTESKRVLDIFRVLKAANTKNADFYVELTEEEQKAFQPFLVSRWMSGTNDARQVYFINELLNPAIFSLPTHKQLLWYLITIANSGRDQRYNWNKLPGKQDTAKPNSVKVVATYFGYNSRDAQDALRILTKEDVLELAKDLGYQPDDLAKIKKELKDGNTTSTNTSSELPPKAPTIQKIDGIEF